MPAKNQMKSNGSTLDPGLLLQTLTAFKKGDFSVRMPVDQTDIAGKIADTLNDIIDQNEKMDKELGRISTTVGGEGRLKQRAAPGAAVGSWKTTVDSVNTLIDGLVQPTIEIVRVVSAIAEGDLSRKVPLETEAGPLKGEFLRTAKTINTMVDQLTTFAAEVTRVALEVGTEGQLGGQAVVEGVSGTWKDLTDTVNTMAANLTSQVRDIAQVTTAVAKGDLSKKITVEAKGEILELKNTINTMVDQLTSFAAEVTRVALEVGTEGQLGGQAVVEGVSGTWKNLTDTVNIMAANLTSQVRGIAEVTTAVTKGDFSRTITVEAKGEVEQLTGNINEMTRVLEETSRTNAEQDWLKTNLGKFSTMLQGQRDMVDVANLVLSELGPLISAQHGLFYLLESVNGEREIKLLGSYAYKERKRLSSRFKLGEGLIGQVALEKKRILLTEVPGDYVQISSGLGAATPLNIVMLPVLFENEIQAILELASLNNFTEIQLSFLDQFAESLGIILTNIAASSQTEQLLKESQTMSEELQTQQEELKQTNEELEEQTQRLAEQKKEVEDKNRAVEETKQSLQEKAEQLTLTSKYKSEFLANMSHELRTPLNSLLILSEKLAENTKGNLTPKQVEFANTIHSSGDDLLQLINEVLDLSKVESGAMEVEVSDVALSDLQANLERSFRQVAKEKGLDFAGELGPGLPQTIHTDPKRLRQVLKNLLSNAFKFTEEGGVTLRISAAQKGWNPDHKALNRAPTVIAFAVSDTGIGIPADKQKVIFEAFQQAEGGSSRNYGGTGLGLSISREIARLLGGEISVESTPGKGSTFTLYLPQSHTPAAPKTSAAPEASGVGDVGGEPADSGPSAADDAGPAVAEPSAADDAGPAVAEPDVPPPGPGEIPDDRDDIQAGDRVLLIVEDDAKFARILLDIAHEKGFKGLVTARGETGLALAKKYKPDAITLDIRLSEEMDGWSVLDRLKHDPETRHIPVHVISVEARRQRALTQGAIACLEKPVSKAALAEVFATIQQFVERRVKKLLVVEDDEAQRKAIVKLIGNHDVDTTEVGTGEEALAAMKSEVFDCVVLDLGLPDMSGFELIDTVKKDPDLQEVPIIVHTGKKLTKKEATELKRVAETIVVKDAKSPERLLDETSLFLHRVEQNLPEPKRKMLRQAHQTDPALAGRKVLIVDDDARNIFAIMSVLESHEMDVMYAETGQEGIQMLQDTPGIDVVLMDIMMPGMDGYETMRKIRKVEKFASLPIIAVTAKAMKGDREKCIEAGASDYIMKPVDIEQLLTLLRVWTYR